MRRTTLIAATWIAAASGLAGTAYSQINRPVTVATAHVANVNASAVLDARVQKLEKQVDALTARVKTLCSSVYKHTIQIKELEDADKSEGVVMQPPSVQGACL